MPDIRYVTAVPVSRAEGRVKRVYQQINADFGLARMPMFMSLSPVPEILAAAWALMRESLIAGEAPRTDKEVVAVGVSIANECPFCVSAHTVLLHATGAHKIAETILDGGVPDDLRLAALLAWSKQPGGVRPFPAELADEYVGTALSFSFINRIASSLLTENLLPANLQNSRLVRRASGRVLAGAVRRKLTRGESLPLMKGPIGPEPIWALGSPVGVAYAGLRTATTADVPLTSTARAAVVAAVEFWDGARPPLTPGWITDALAPVPAAERPAVRLSVLAALAPYRLADTDVEAWRTTQPPAEADADVVRLIAYGAFTATDHLATRLSNATNATTL